MGVWLLRNLMKIKLIHSEISGNKSSKKDVTIELKKSITIRKLLEFLKEDKEFTNNFTSIFIVNGEVKGIDYKVKDEDVIYIIPMFSGG